MSHDLAVTLSVTTGDSVDTKNGPVRVEGVYDYPDDGRAPGLGYAAIFIEPVTASTMFDACWMDAPYPAEDTRSLIWTSVETIGQAAKPTLGQLNSTMGVSFDAISAFNSRPSESFPWVALLLGSVVGFVPVRFRRLELASALHSRIPKAGLTLQVMLENLFWLIPAVLVVSGASLFLSQTALESDFISIASAGFRIVGLGSIGVLLGSIVGVLVTRERDLFKYFKER
ncbi:hypothetical protein [Agreia sp. VKM Ac-1783]|uniref:hypothetical protein n=1 Tax=Agreia sp. VKM Ac-1783 TaxID=1938889 RepID=UPI0011222379|nr:hypothetical protein [Agreia sp. VKM Ac-1783]